MKPLRPPALLATGLSLLLGVLAPGCGSQSGTGNDDGNHDGGSTTPDLSVPIPKGAIDLNTGPVPVASGKERTVCLTGRFPVTVATDVSKIATRQTSTHHVIFYKYQPGAKPTVNTTPEDCPPLDVIGSGMLKAPLFIGESSDQTQNVLSLPPGVVYHIEPDDYYTIEVHIVNASPSDISPSIDVFLTPVAPNTQVVYADMIFFNNAKGLGKKYDGKSGGLPPMTTTTIDPGFGAVRTDFKIFGVTTHQHHLGTGIAVSKSSGAADPGTALFTNPDWQHPALYHLPDDQPLTFKQGEGLRWVCSYNNTTTGYVRFGESGISDEMCIIWAYYYPSAGFQLVWN